MVGFGVALESFGDFWWILWFLVVLVGFGGFFLPLVVFGGLDGFWFEKWLKIFLQTNSLDHGWRTMVKKFAK